MCRVEHPWPWQSRNESAPLYQDKSGVSNARSADDLKAVIIEESLCVLEYKRGVRFIDIIDKLWEEQMPFERFPRVPNQC